MLFTYALCIINALLASIAIVTNIIVFLAIISTPHLHNPSNVLLCSLTVSDFGVGSIVQPVFVFYLMGYRKLLLSAFGLSAVFFTGVSFVTMTLLAIDRVLALQLHLRYNGMVTVKRTLLLLAILWTSAALSLVQFERGNFFVSMGIIVGCSLKGCTITSVCYFKIIRTVRRHKREIQAQMQAFNTPAIRQSCSLITMFIIHAIFVACILPFVITLLYISFTSDNQVEDVYSSRNIFWTSTLVLMNSSVNPCVYFWRMRSLRSAVKKLLHKVLDLINCT